MYSKTKYNNKAILHILTDVLAVTPVKENYRSLIFDCPACGAKEKLYVEKKTGLSICFRHKNEDCPTSKTPLIKVAALLSGTTEEEINNKLLEFNQKSVFRDVVFSENDQEFDCEISLFTHLKPPTNKKTETKALPEIKLPEHFLSIDHPEAKDGVEYLLGRGIPMELAKQYNIGYSPVLKRVIFPVIMNGKYVGWQARTIIPNIEPRMLNSTGEWKRNSLMFHDNIVNGDFVIVAEGAVSALKWAFVGNFVATMGKLISQEQIRLILRPNIKNVYLALDADAYVEAAELTRRIKLIDRGVNVYLLPVPQDKDDFGECTFEECLKIFYNKKITLSADAMELYEVYGLNERLKI